MMELHRGLARGLSPAGISRSPPRFHPFRFVSWKKSIRFAFPKILVLKFSKKAHTSASEIRVKWRSMSELVADTFFHELANHSAIFRIDEVPNCAPAHVCQQITVIEKSKSRMQFAQRRHLFLLLFLLLFQQI